MNPKLRPLLIGAALIGVIAIAILLYLHFRVTPETLTGCNTLEKKVKVHDPLMQEAIPDGQEVRFVYGWYHCHKVEKGDLVLFRYATTAEPVIRVVRAAEGDHFQLQPDAERPAWNLKINGEVIQASKRPYFFGAKTQPTLSLYYKSRNGILNAGEVILLSTLPPGNLDSGILGVLSVKDLIGKVETLPESH